MNDNLLCGAAERDGDTPAGPADLQLHRPAAPMADRGDSARQQRAIGLFSRLSIVLFEYRDHRCKATVDPNVDDVSGVLLYTRHRVSHLMPQLVSGASDGTTGLG